MRIVKLSKEEFGTLQDVRSFFLDKDDKDGIRRRKPPGKFRVTKGRIAPGALEVGEPLVFTYEARVVFTARAGNKLVPNNDQEREKYPSYLVVDLDTLCEADEDLHDVERQYIDATRAGVNLVRSQGWNGLVDSAHTEAIWARLRAPADFTLAEEITDTDPAGLVEGAVCAIKVNAYERNPEARRRCIERHGTSCSICGFNFGATYGKPAQGLIHVHHLRSLSEIGRQYVVDPVEDLRPVCPNCHAVLHRHVPPYSIEEVRTFLR